MAVARGRSGGRRPEGTGRRRRSRWSVEAADGRRRRSAVGGEVGGRDDSGVLTRSGVTRRLAAQRAAVKEVEKACTFQPALTSKGKRHTSPTSDSITGLLHARAPTMRTKSRPSSSEDREIAEHCSFQPKTNHYPDGGVGHRIDCDDPHQDEQLMAAFRSSYQPRHHSKNPTGYVPLRVGSHGSYAAAAALLFASRVARRAADRSETLIGLPAASLMNASNCN